jgi:PEGA domain
MTPIRSATHSRPRRPSRAALLASAFLFAFSIHPQTPPAPARLVISSEPTNAAVTINGNKMTQNTNATFLVSPGTYTIAVASADGKVACNQPPNSGPKAARTVTVSSGDTAQLDCTPTGWK